MAHGERIVSKAVRLIRENKVHRTDDGTVYIVEGDSHHYVVAIIDPGELSKTVVSCNCPAGIRHFFEKGADICSHGTAALTLNEGRRE